MSKRTMGAAEWALLLALSLLWGGSFFFNAVALQSLPHLTVVLGRVGLAALALCVLILLRGEPLPRRAGVWGGLFVMGLLNNVLPFGLIVWGQQHIDSGLAAILNATTPIFAVLLAHIVTSDERLTRGRVAGVLLGFAGAVTLIGPSALGGIGYAGLGQLAVLGAALSYACAGLFGRRFSGLSPLVAAAGMLGGATVGLLPITLALEAPWALAPTPASLLAVLANALLGTALAYLIYFRLLARAGATNLLLVTFLIPVSALLLGILVLGERPQASAFLGMALIFLGLAAIDGRLPARLGFRRRRAARRGAWVGRSPPPGG